jgi:hypothetical protein
MSTAHANGSVEACATDDAAGNVGVSVERTTPRRVLVPTSVAVLAFALLAALAQPWPAFAESSGPASGDSAAAGGNAACFYRQFWLGRWKTTPDARAIYISVAGQVYRLDLDTAYPLLKSTWAQLYDSDSSNTICSAIDFQLVLSNQLGVREFVIVRHLTHLTPAEVAALPKSLRP